MKLPCACPRCDALIAEVIFKSWGDGQQTTHVAPYLCNTCASFFVANLVTGELVPMPDEAIELLRTKNSTLWQSLMEEQRRIRQRANYRAPRPYAEVKP